MPVILDPGMQNIEGVVSDMLKPYDARVMMRRLTR